MKEIKFRSAHYTHVDKIFTHFSYWGLIDHKGNYSNDCFCSPSTNSGTFRKSEEQFTGLKDKKGNEVYEGDYLVDRYPINDEDLSEGYNESLLPVMWCSEKHCWCVDVTFAKNGERLEPIYSYFGDNLEVKGNIHQKQ